MFADSRFGGTVPDGPDFDPSDLAGLALWFDASTIAGHSDGDPVSTWPDASGNGRDATQGTAANRPTYRTGVQNGLPAVRFDGTNDYLLTATFASALSQPNTIFVVAKWSGSRSYLVDGASTNRNAIGYEVASAGSQRVHIYAGSTAMQSAATFTRPSTIEMWLAEVNGASSRFRYQAGLMFIGNPGAQALGRLTIGAGNGGAFSYLNGDVCEIVVYNGSLTTAQRWQVEQYLSDKWQVTAPRRPDTPLTIPTYDGSGEATHPDVIDFLLAHDLASWNGYRYWMAMTPYPGGNSAHENPSIVVSNDGQTWSEPPGISNPVVAAPGSGHNSDCDLVFDGTDLWLFWRETDGSTTDWIKCASSSDGVTWSSATTILSGAWASMLSPAVVLDGSTWKMWTVDWTATPNTVDYRTSSAPDSGWSAATSGTFSSLPSGKEPWHIDVTVDPRDNSLHALLNVQDSGTTAANTALAIARSNDGTSWSCSDVIFDVPLYPGAWDSSRIYRASFCIKDEDTYAVWYSAEEVEAAAIWNIGYAELSTWEAPDPP